MRLSFVDLPAFNNTCKSMILVTYAKRSFTLSQLISAQKFSK